MKKGDLPKDPRDYFVRAESELSLGELAKVYKGRKGCSYGQICRRSAAEKWVSQRDVFAKERRIKTDEKTIEKSSEQQSKTIHQVNDEALKRADMLTKINEELLKSYFVVEKQADGSETKSLKCTARELRQVTQTLIDLEHAKRLFLNIEPNKPYETGAAAADGAGNLNELIKVLKDSKS